MAKQRYIGVVIIGGLLTFIGGVSSLLLVLEVIDSLRLFGANSLGISSVVALQGFFLYAALPVMLYATGIGILTARPWAHTLVIFGIPGLLFFYFFHMSSLIVRSQYDLYQVGILELLGSHPGVFLGVFLRYAVMMGLLIFYFQRPRVRAYFRAPQE